MKVIVYLLNIKGRPILDDWLLEKYSDEKVLVLGTRIILWAPYSDTGYSSTRILEAAVETGT